MKKTVNIPGVNCPKCSFASEAPEQCPRCGVVFKSYEKYQAHQALRTQAGAMLAPVPAQDAWLGIEEYKIDRLAFPAALLLTALAKLLVFPDAIFWYFFQIPTHEFGHSVAAWLGSRFALPIGAFIPMAAFTARGGSFSLFVFLAVLAGSGALGYRALKQRCYFPVFMSAVTISLSVYCSFLLSEFNLNMLFIYGGVAGEFILSTFLIVSFYYDYPKGLRWDFFRFPFLLMGTFTLTSAVLLWGKIARGIEAMPSGSFLNGSSDASGDMDRLISQFGWSAKTLVTHFNYLGKLCGGLVLLHYFVFLFKSMNLRKMKIERD